MKRGRITTLILFGVLGILLLLYFIFASGDGKKRYQWYESYRVSSDQPYGTLFIKRLLEGYRPGGHFIFNDKKSLTTLLDSSNVKPNSDYVFIGQSLYLDDRDAGALTNFIYSGNDAFVASLEPPEALISRIYQDECDQKLIFHENEVDSITLNFYHDTLRTEKGYQFMYRFGSDDHSYFWNYLNEEIICDSTKSIVPLGFIAPASVNFFRIPHGAGNLYIHSNPIVFTNYFLSKSEKVVYASGVFSHLTGKNIIWDEYSKVPLIGNNNVYDSPLYYILQQPSLKYAWWLLLVSAVLYVLFTSKRTQRVIPVLEPKTNTSLEFVKLISSLHYQNNNHLDMAKKKMKYFLYFIRSKYGIHTQTLSDAQVLKLAEKSKVNVRDIQIIVDQYQLIEQKFQQHIEADRLVNLYSAIENFYKNCK